MNKNMDEEHINGGIVLVRIIEGNNLGVSISSDNRIREKDK